MDIRNILRKKQEDKKQKIIRFIIAIIVLSLGIILLSNIAKNNQKPVYKVGDTIQISGIIVLDNNYPINTHKIFNDNNSTFGIKSSSTNLNNFVDKHMIVNGTISEISNKYPILEMNYIKDPYNNIIIKNNEYFFTNELISFNFSQDTDIKADKNENNNIEIYYQNDPVISIETFICNKVTPTQDCEQLIYEYTNNLNEMFTTYLGYTFYKVKENSRVTFNNQTLGYIINTKDNEFLLDISHLIKIIDSKFIAENKKDLIQTHCIGTSGDYLDTISKISTQIIDKDLTRLNIDGISKSNKKVNCKLTINIGNNREIKNNILKYISD